jgi:phosphate transport system ATP-binding protein
LRVTYGEEVSRKRRPYNAVLFWNGKQEAKGLATDGAFRSLPAPSRCAWGQASVFGEAAPPNNSCERNSSHVLKALQMKDMAKVSVQKFSVFFGQAESLRKISIDIAAHQIFGIIGPSGSGKTTFLRALNRLNDLVPDCRTAGAMLLDGKNIYDPDFDVVQLRKRVGIVFALPIALPMSIYDNLAYGPRLSGTRKRERLDDLVERSLKAAFLWEEVRDRLKTSALRLSGGQQQRLCLARVLAMESEIILLDEPCSGLDPVSTAKIEEALTVLKSKYTIILVTNNTKQAARIADNTAFFLQGELIEFGVTDRIFTAPTDKRTNDYVTGRFG